jgi:hypothetical protein
MTRQSAQGVIILSGPEFAQNLAHWPSWRRGIGCHPCGSSGSSLLSEDFFRTAPILLTYRPRGRLRGQDSHGSQSGGLARAAAHEICAGHQREDCAVAWPHDSALTTAARGRSGSVIECPGLFPAFAHFCAARLHTDVDWLLSRSRPALTGRLRPLRDPDELTIEGAELELKLD